MLSTDQTTSFATKKDAQKAKQPTIQSYWFESDDFSSFLSLYGLSRHLHALATIELASCYLFTKKKFDFVGFVWQYFFDECLFELSASKIEASFNGFIPCCCCYCCCQAKQICFSFSHETLCVFVWLCLQRSFHVHTINMRQISFDYRAHDAHERHLNKLWHNNSNAQRKIAIVKNRWKAEMFQFNLIFLFYIFDWFSTM